MTVLKFSFINPQSSWKQRTLRNCNRSDFILLFKNIFISFLRISLQCILNNFNSHEVPVNLGSGVCSVMLSAFWEGITSLKKKTNSPFSNSYQIPKVPQVVMAFHIHLPLFCAGILFGWLKLVQVLCMPSSLLWAHMCSSPAVSRKHCFLDVFNRSVPSSLKIPELWGQEYSMHVPVRAEHSTASKSLHGDQTNSFILEEGYGQHTIVSTIHRWQRNYLVKAKG